MARPQNGDGAEPGEPRAKADAVPDGEGNEAGSFASLVGDVTRLEPASQSSGRQRPPPPRRHRDTDVRTDFLFPDPLEPRYGRARDCSERTLHLLLGGEPAPAERIDLHGLDREGARLLLARRLESAAARDLACVLVIHGHGRRSAEATGVLKEALPGWLTSAPCDKTVRAFAPARGRDGGEGASYVLLRSPK